MTWGRDRKDENKIYSCIKFSKKILTFVNIFVNRTA